MRINYSSLLKRSLAALPMIMISAACGAAPLSASMAPPFSTTAPAATSTPVLATSATAASDQQAVRSVVEQFGQKLQAVSLQAPPELVAQALQQQYAAFVSPELLNTWVNDPLRAPGRLVSSPWPDRIEITNIIRDSETHYTVTGNEVEVTSVELVNGGRAGQQPVRLTVEKQQGRWVITAYTRTN